MHSHSRRNQFRAVLLLIVAFAALSIFLLRAPVTAQPATPTPTATNTPAIVASVNSSPLFRIDFASRASLNRLAAAYDVWEVHYLPNQTERGWALIQADSNDIARLRLEGYAPSPLSSDDGAIAAEGQGEVCGGSTIGTFPCYRSVVETYADLSALASGHTGLADWVDIGDTWEKATPGGNAGDDLRVLVVTNEAISTPKFKFFLLGAVHARELATAETAARFAAMLVNGYGINPDITWLLDHGEAHILAQANPDGRKRAEAGYCWRKNTRDDGSCAIGFSSGPGVDLNRNYAFKWNQCTFSGCSSANQCSLTYRGTGPASEPETLAVQNYLASIFPDARGPAITAAAALNTPGLLISLHSYGELVLFPWGFTDDTSPNWPQLQMLADKFGYVTGYRACAAGAPGCLYNTDGTTDDWLYGERGTAAFTIEMGTNFFQTCTTYENSMVDDLLDTLLYAFKAARRPYQTPFGPEPVDLALSAPTLLQGAPFTLTATLDTTRVEDNDGRPFGSVVTPTTVLSASWSLDGPSWVTNTVAAAMQPVDGIFDEAIEQVQVTIDTDGLALGKHLLFVEGIDNNGQNGVPSAVFVEIAGELPPAPTPAARIFNPLIQSGGD